MRRSRSRAGKARKNTVSALRVKLWYSLLKRDAHLSKPQENK
jgi:hypothetical protein